MQWLHQMITLQLLHQGDIVVRKIFVDKSLLVGNFSRFLFLPNRVPESHITPFSILQDRDIVKASLSLTVII